VKPWTRLVVLLPLAFFMLSCEEDDPNYAADIINTYILESVTELGMTEDLTDVALEDAVFIEITRDDVYFYANDYDHCDANYDTDYVDSFEIDEVTETSIVYTDGTNDSYRIEDGKLIITTEGDIAVLAVYDDAIPPAVWSDPNLLTNDTYESDNSFALATAIAAGGTVQNHYLGECEDQDYYMFTAESGSIYTLATTTAETSDLDLTLTLYDANNNELDFADDINYPINKNPRLEWTCPASGDYYFVVEGFSEWEFGDYSVSVVIATGLTKAPAPSGENKTRDYQRTNLKKFSFH